MKGRCLERSKNTLILLNQAGIHKLQIAEDCEIEIGDLCEVLPTGESLVLTKNKTNQDRFYFTQNTLLHPKKKANLLVRQKVESLIRNFFLKNDFLEIRTPLLVASPGMEPHICPMKVQPDLHQNKEGSFLPTSPEFAMKKLMVGGLEKIFQITPCFRSEPQSSTHLPEFTLLEWYRAYENYTQIMHDTENLIHEIAVSLFQKSELVYQGKKINLTPPWPKLTIRSLFQKEVGIDLAECPDFTRLQKKCLESGLHQKIPHFEETHDFDDLYFRIWLNLIEDKLPQDTPVIVCDYPPSQAALSKCAVSEDGYAYAQRFEVYIAGLEIANAFEELTDPEEQLTRFLEDQKKRKNYYGDQYPQSPIDLEFITALKEGLPPSSGIALGVDRLIMLFANEPDIKNTFWLMPHY